MPDLVLLAERGGWVSQAEAASALGVSRGRVQQLLRAGRLATDPTGHITAQSVAALLVERMEPSAGPGISQAEAGRRLGVGKTRVQQLLGAGRLARSAAGAVDPASVDRLIAERARAAAADE
ncbi:MAG: hypothetical protein ACRDX8_07125 [Acidimicrobiales bacterium]